MSVVEVLIQRQLDAYNARDLESWAGTYAEYARQYQYPDTLLAEGREAIKARGRERFAEADLHAALRHRIVNGEVVIDHETVTRTVAGRRMQADLVCVYQVANGAIVRADFISGPLCEVDSKARETA